MKKKKDSGYDFIKPTRVIERPAKKGDSFETWDEQFAREKGKPLHFQRKDTREILCGAGKYIATYKYKTQNRRKVNCGNCLKLLRKNNTFHD